MQLNPVDLTNPKDHEVILNHMNQARHLGLFDEFLVAVLLHRFWKKLLPETRLAASLAIEETLSLHFPVQWLDSLGLSGGAKHQMRVDQQRGTR